MLLFYIYYEGNFKKYIKLKYEQTFYLTTINFFLTKPVLRIVTFANNLHYNLIAYFNSLYYNFTN